jgi:coenzyme Q-binding protein COQ10
MSRMVSRELVIGVPLERFYALVVDYGRYPEFVPALRAIRHKGGPDGLDWEYEVDLGVKTIRYTLRHVHEAPRRVSWSLVESQWMKVSNGSWELSDVEGKTLARYSLEVQVAKPPLIPQSLVDRISDELTAVQLPRTLHAFKVRAEKG